MKSFSSVLRSRLLASPWSLRGFATTMLIVAASAGLQLIFVAAGVQLHYAAFFPAVFIAGFVAGWPAGAFAIAIAFPLVWWAFIPPSFEFSPLTPADYEATKIFLLVSGLLAFLSDLGQEMLASEMQSEDGS